MSKTDQWFDSLSSNSPEWAIMALRNHSDKPFPNYLSRLHNSIHRIFAPWFCGHVNSPFSHLPYTEILKQQHIELVIGSDGGQIYTGVTCRDHGIILDIQISPGQFRHQIIPRNEFIHIMPFRIDSKFPEDVSPRLKKLINGYIQDPSNDKMTEPHEILPLLDFKEGPHCSVDVIKLPRIHGLKVGIYNKIYSNYISHHYPDHADKDLIINTMSIIINEIKHLSKQELRDNEKFLYLLEEYLYLGIHAHPFESVNFSIIMAQVNFILSRFGFKGISPSNIDWVGVSEQFTEFRANFRQKLIKVNPQVANIALKTSRSPWISILVHIGDGVGDRFFSEGELIEHKDNSFRKRIEGIMITPVLPDDLTIEYMSHIEDYGDTAWIPARTYMGTWGQSKAIEGVAFRFNGPQKDNYNINYCARLKDGEWTPICKNGQYCGTKGKRKAITGLQIWINEN